jgi:hypothetical protein
MRFSLLLGFTFAAATASYGDEPKKRPDTDWVGIYSSPAEIGGFSGTVIAIHNDIGLGGRLVYRMTFYSDVVSEDDITEKEKSGTLLTDGDKLYVPVAHGYYVDKRPHLLAFVDRYTRVQINGRTVLLRDDALKAFRERNQLYDYGVLIKAADNVDPVEGLDKVKHESIKVLYADQSKDWKDPFIDGPNSR